MTARRLAPTRTTLLAVATLALSLAQPGAAQPYADERWGPIPPPGKGLRPVETPLCRPGQGRLCEFAFGPDRRLRVPPSCCIRWASAWPAATGWSDEATSSPGTSRTSARAASCA